VAAENYIEELMAKKESDDLNTRKLLEEAQLREDEAHHRAE
jgi:hypothetical protein